MRQELAVSFARMCFGDLLHGLYVNSTSYYVNLLRFVLEFTKENIFVEYLVKL